MSHVQVTRRHQAVRTVTTIVLVALIAGGCGDTSAPPGPTRPQVTSPTTPTSPTTTSAVPTTGEGLSDIYSIAVDGSDLQRMTFAKDGAGYDRAVWSHDGTRLAASGPPCDDCAERISLIDASGDHAIVDVPTRSEGVAAPSWSPDDRRLVYVGGPTNAVLAADVDGSDEVALIDDRKQHSSAAWSPDGTLIAFTTQSTSGGSVIEVMLPDGSARRRLTAVGQIAEQPAWSPDGRRIAFARQSGANWTIATVSVAGGPVRDVTDPTQNSQQPTWSPDGRQIAFTAITDQTTSLAVMNADGSARRSIRTGTPRASAPSWSPDGRRIAFAVRY